ncbi:MAG: AAA family ATPase [Patescibacteria group bacterium]|nr:AAA family ATPase [Patescibacteria group bacterium]
MSIEKVIGNIIEILKEFYDLDLIQIEALKNSDDKLVISKEILKILFKNNISSVRNEKKDKKEEKKKIKRYTSHCTLRHRFPKFLAKAKQEEFIELVIELLADCQLHITIIIGGGNTNYFYISGLESIINLLLNIDLDGIFEKKKIKEMFDKPCLIYFKEGFMEKIFGPDGLLKKKGFSIPKFIETVSLQNEFSRQNVYNWKKGGYFPVNFFKIFMIRFEQFNDYYRYIDYVKIGNSNKISKDLLNKIFEQIKNFEKYISHSELNEIFKQFNIVQRLNIIEKYDDLIKNVQNEREIKYLDYVELIRSKFDISDDRTLIKSVELVNFKSYKREKIDFESGINILYGKNGSGKTSLIEAVLFALLRLHPQHSLYYNPDPSESRSPAYIFLLNTWLIRAGEEVCEVKLTLKIREKEIIIVRSISRDLTQELKIFDGDEEIPLISFKKDPNIPSLVINSSEIKLLHLDKEECLEEAQIYSENQELYTEFIFSEFEKRGLFFEKNEIFSSFFNEYHFFWDWDEINKRKRKIKNYYRNKFRMNYLYNLIKDLKRKRIKLLCNQAKLISSLKKNLDDMELYTDINENKYYKITSGECIKCNDICESEDGDRYHFNELLEQGYISKDNFFKTYYPVETHHGTTCQKCGAYYCDYHHQWMDYDCEKCDNDLEANLYRRRELHVLPSQFLKILKFSSNIDEKIYEEIYRDNYNQFKRIVKQEKYHPLLVENFDLELDNHCFNEISLIYELLIHHYTYIIESLKFLLLGGQEPNLNSLIKNIETFNKRDKINPNIDYINHIVLIIIFYIQNLISNNSTILIRLDLLIKDTMKSCYNSSSQIHHLSSSSIETSMYRILYNTINLLKSPLFSRIDHLIEAHQGDIDDFLQIYEKHFHNSLSKRYYGFIYGEIKIVKTPQKDYHPNIIYYGEYDIQKYLETDFNVFVTQVENVMKIISWVKKVSEKLKKNTEEIENLEDRINFIKEHSALIYKNVFIKFLNEELKRLAPKIFKESNKFYGFLDEDSFHKIQFQNGKIAPLNILSNGEKSKFFLALICILANLSNNSLFFLIDEPNELLDTENISIIKDFFSPLFRTKQLILCTYIKKYLETEPTQKFEVRKHLDGTSYIEEK